MKKNNSLYSKLMDTLKSSNKKNQNLIHLSVNFSKLLSAGFIALFALTSVPSQAQVANAGLTAMFNQDKSEIQQARTNLNEIREENRQVKELNNIPESIVEKFKMNYPNATNVEWTAPGPDIEANFTDGNHHDIAFYDYNTGDLTGTGHYLSYENLPSRALKTIKKDFPEYTPVKVLYYDDNEDNSLSEALMQFPVDRDIYFVKMKNGNSNIALEVTLDGDVTKVADLK